MDKIVSLINNRSQGIRHAYSNDASHITVVDLDGVRIEFLYACFNSQTMLSWTYIPFWFGRQRSIQETVVFDNQKFDQFEDMIHHFVVSAFILNEKYKKNWF